jgi:hypothetical protein
MTIPNEDTRTTAFTAAEFAGLERNTNGDLIELDRAYPFISDKQRDALTGDDMSRMDNLDEELRYLMADAAAEFGGMEL